MKKNFVNLVLVTALCAALAFVVRVGAVQANPAWNCSTPPDYHFVLVGQAFWVYNDSANNENAQTVHVILTPGGTFNLTAPQVNAGQHKALTGSITLPDGAFSWTATGQTDASCQDSGSYAPTATPTATETNYLLNFSHATCLASGEIEFHFVVVHINPGDVLSPVSFTANGSDHQAPLTNQEAHEAGFTLNLPGGLYVISAASVTVNGVLVTLHNPGTYGDANCHAPSATPTSTDQPTASPTPSQTQTSTEASATPTHTPTETQTTEPSTATPTHTPEPSATRTNTPESSASPTNTLEPSATPTHTPEPSATPSATEGPSATPTNTTAASPTPTNTAPPSPTPTNTQVPTATNTQPGPSPTPTNTTPPTETSTAEITPTQSKTPPPTDVPFQPPTGSDNCDGATLTNNANHGLAVVLYVDGAEIWRGDLGVYQTISVRWPAAIVSGTGSLAWDDRAGRAGSIGLGAFEPCGQATPVVTPTSLPQGEGAEAASAPYVALGTLDIPSLGLHLTVGSGWTDAIGEFHHALPIAGKLNDSAYGIHQSFAPELAGLHAGASVSIDGLNYRVAQVVIVPQKDPRVMASLLSQWTTITTCTPDWLSNEVLLLAPYARHLLDW